VPKTLVVRCVFIAFAGAMSHLPYAYADGEAPSAGMEGSATPQGKAFDDENAESQVSSGKLQEVVVNARRREEDIQTVPLTVIAISQQALQAENVQTLNDLTYLVPSLTGTTNIPNGVRLSLRGQGPTGNASWPAVVEFMNEVPIPNFPSGSNSTGPGLFFDLESVQVLEGPQGTLFGKGSPGGDILLQSARPTNDFGGRVQVSYGNYSDKEVDGAFNLPLINDVLLARIAFNTQLRDGYTHVLGEPSYPNGVDADNRDSQSVRATLVFRPTDWIQNDLILLNSEYSSRDIYGVLTEVIPGGPIATQYPQITALLAQQQGLGIRTAIPISVDAVANGFSKSVTNITRVTLPYDLTLKNIFGYHQENQVLSSDQDNSVIPYFDVYATPRSQTVTQESEELQLAGKTFGDRLDWIVGGFYEDQPPPGEYTVENLRVEGNSQYDVNRSGQDSRALYAHGIYDLSLILPGVRLNAGIRYTKDDYSYSVFNNSAAGAGFCVGDPDSCLTGTPTTTRGNSHALTWVAGVDDQITANTLLYLTSSKGYRPGGDNGANILAGGNLPSFGPEYVTEEELGIKSDWKLADVPIRTNADVWYQDYTDIQETVAHGPNLSYTQNAGLAHLWGAELEAVAEITADLELGVTYDHGTIQYKSFAAGVSPAAIAALEATRTFNFPPNKYGVNARYRLPLADEVGDLSVRANWHWQATSGDTSVANGFGLTHSFGLLNMTADWSSVYGKPFDVSLFASNLLNKVYVTQAVPSFEPSAFGYGNELYGEPRMYGIRVRYRFGADAK
jgi:iron complex outermembrane recepter protein